MKFAARCPLCSRVLRAETMFVLELRAHEHIALCEESLAIKRAAAEASARQGRLF